MKQRLSKDEGRLGEEDPAVGLHGLRLSARTTASVQQNDAMNSKVARQQILGLHSFVDSGVPIWAETADDDLSPPTVDSRGLQGSGSFCDAQRWPVQLALHG